MRKIIMLLSIAVQYDAEIKNENYIKYKNLYLKYITRKDNTESDTLTAFFYAVNEKDV